MEITVKAKQLDIGDALRGHVESCLTEGVTKYFENALDATVTFSREAHSFRADISVHPGRGLMVKGGGMGGDAYVAFDSALERIAKQLRRYKRRLRNHHKGGEREDEIMAQYAIIQPEPEEKEVEEDAQPAIIAEMPHHVSTLSVSEAVMRMDLADAPAMMFRNSAHGGLNVVYRRADGNIGWIDPPGADA
ncbi:MAG: ribosome-associated translation inhibitor RaiA [Rhodobacterales bacterium]|nr:ribosome-associated translation inhibitor RaiA [Rhodobacterales bacterium]